MTKTYGTDTLALRAASDTTALETLIDTSEGFILRCASSTTKRFITRSDDEWSIALGAFSSAVSSYNPDKGHFYPYAELVIKHRMLDYLGSNARFRHEIPVDPEVFDEPPDDDSPQPALQAAVLDKVAYSQDNSLRWEIEALGNCLSFYGIAFMELATCSPRTDKTKRSTAIAIAAILHNPIVMLEMQTTRMLPIIAIIKLTGLPRKILERHRKYIIAAVEIFDGGYDGLAEYLRYVRKELE